MKLKRLGRSQAWGMDVRDGLGQHRGERAAVGEGDHLRVCIN